ncbi:MAG: hypothetical protein HY444_00030 [Nitrospirae bacterium]|nr:hypothetical protein [Nitrospirota bacterium]
MGRASALALPCVLMLLAGCLHGDPRQSQPAGCVDIVRSLDLSDRIGTLNLLSQAFSRKCYPTVVDYGARAQSEFRHKTFHILKETASVFIPDGTLTDYVLESYERGYLSVLMAASYFNLQQLDEAKVELRRLDHELFTSLYNYGEDPVNVLLSAVLWEQVGEPAEARVDWLRLRDLRSLLKERDERLRSFADLQIKRIDEGRPVEGKWHLYPVGTFPGVDWDLQFTGSDNGYFRVTATGNFPAACVSQTGALLSTHSWFEKIATRHSNAYHPLLNVQSWIRLPVGVTYSLIPVAAGAGIAVGGCMLDAAGEGKGALCEIAIRGGVALMSTAPHVLRGALEPDLRHWGQIPSAFVVTTASDPVHEPCAAGKAFAP